MSLRRLLRLLGAAFLVFGGVVAGAQPAWAHANLLSTEPEYGAALTVTPDRAVIRYDLPVEVEGAQLKLERSGESLRVGRPGYASPDRKDVFLPLPKGGPGKYVLTWFLFGSDGDVMGGELDFTVVGDAASATGVASGRPAGGRLARNRSFAPLSQAQDAARLVAFASLSVLLGGVAFLALLWPAGAPLRRTRILLWGALAGALVGNAAALGLKGAAVSGQSALGLFSPAALTALHGTHVGRVLTARLALLLVVIPFLAYLLAMPRRALHSGHWGLGIVGVALGALTTHGMLSHASSRGLLASAADVVHLGAVVVWLGGLVMLAVVVLPRRRSSELSFIVPRWSQLAFGAMSTAVLAGALLLLLISPRWSALPNSSYGRFLLIKLLLVGMLLIFAARAREFVWRHLPRLIAAPDVDLRQDIMDLTVVEPVPGVPVAVGAGGAPGEMAPRTTLAVAGRGRPADDPASTVPAHPVAGPAPSHRLVDAAALGPFVSAVTAELCIAASILAATAVLVGRPPPT
jgi:copper transport protein